MLKSVFKSSMMSNNKKRRKRDCEVLNRQELYEKYIPHISQDFAKIIDKSKNYEFKQRCQQHLKVDDPGKIEGAISEQLFKLTLGKQTNLNVSYKTQDQENGVARGKVNQADIQSCFGDLADHVDDDIWPAFDESSSLTARSEVNAISSQCPPTMPKIHTHETRSRIQGTGIRQSLEKGSDVSRKNYKLDVTGDGISDDENFNSLELHAMLDETTWPNTATCCPGDQSVPYGDATATISHYHQPVLQHSGTKKQGNAPTESDDSHFETLGNLF